MAKWSSWNNLTEAVVEYHFFILESPQVFMKSIEIWNGEKTRFMQSENVECLIYNFMSFKKLYHGLKQRNLKPKEVKVFPCPERPGRCFLIVSLHGLFGQATARFRVTILNFQSRPMQMTKHGSKMSLLHITRYQLL